MALAAGAGDGFTRAMLKAMNGMMLDMLAAIARKDYQDRCRRQEEGSLKQKRLENFADVRLTFSCTLRSLNSELKISKASRIRPDYAGFQKEQLYV
jgi:DNA invertase Pin-like site-specific DNA recombinase